MKKITCLIFKHALTLLRLEPEQDLAMAKETQERGLPLQKTMEKLRQIAPDGDVAELLRQTVEKLISGAKR